MLLEYVNFQKLRKANYLSNQILMMEINFNLDKEWEVVNSEMFKKNPEYSNPIRDILLFLQIILSRIDVCSDNKKRAALIVKYIGYKNMYFSFIYGQN